MAGTQWINEDIGYTIFKKHPCPECGERLARSQTSKVVNSASPEARYYDFSMGDGFMVGDVRFVWTVFRCPACEKTYTVEELKSIERGYAVIDDQRIVAVTPGTADEVAGIVYRDSHGELHTIDLKVCAENFRAESGSTSNNCVGMRNSEAWWFLLFTDRLKSKIVFNRWCVLDLRARKLLSGTRRARFHKLQNLLNEMAYTTWDQT